MAARVLLPRLALTAALLTMAWFAGRQALGDLLVQGPRVDLMRMLSRPGPVDPAVLRRERDDLVAAARLDPSNPQAREFLGQIDALRAAQAGTDAARRRVLVDLALGDYAEALRLRPNSPYLWSARMQLLEQAAMLRPLSDAEVGAFRVAMRRTVDFGPWEPELLQQVVAAGQVMEPALDDPARGAAATAAAHLLRLGIPAQIKP